MYLATRSRTLEMTSSVEYVEGDIQKETQRRQRRDSGGRWSGTDHGNSHKPEFLKLTSPSSGRNTNALS